jgi:adenosine deaminase
MVREYQKKYRQAPKLKAYHRAYYLKATYGLTLEAYDRMFREQNGNCAICGKNQSVIEKSLAVAFPTQHTNSLTRSPVGPKGERVSQRIPYPGDRPPGCHFA